MCSRLRAWGTDVFKNCAACSPSPSGTRRRSASCALLRDLFGIKPFYYQHDGNH
ncbi:MAG: hypothetical protein ACLR3C_12690 [Eggerthella lenta]